MRMAKNEKEADYKTIRASSYNTMYKDIVLEEAEEKEYYWLKEKGGSSYKEVWSRVRCGNLGRAPKKKGGKIGHAGDAKANRRP